MPAFALAASGAYHIFLPMPSRKYNGMSLIGNVEIGSRVAPIQELVMEVEFHPRYSSKFGILIVDDDIYMLPIPLMVVYPIVERVEIPVLNDVLIHVLSFILARIELYEPISK